MVTLSGSSLGAGDSWLEGNFVEDDFCMLSLNISQFVCFRTYEKKLWAVIKIQSHVRTMIAMRQYRKLKVSFVLFNFDSPQNVLEEPLGHRQHATLYDCALR